MYFRSWLLWSSWAVCLPSIHALDFIRAALPFALFDGQPGYFTAVQTFDVDQKGRSDFVFSGGRHTLQGQGWILPQDDLLSFSESTSFGSLGGYTGIGVLRKDRRNLYLLLAGGSCHICRDTDPWCYNADPTCTAENTLTTAKLFQYNQCTKDVDEIWEDPEENLSNRAGTLTMWNNQPAVVLVGNNGLDVHARQAERCWRKVDHFEPVFHQAAPNDQFNQRGARYVGLAVNHTEAGTRIVLGGKKSDVLVDRVEIADGGSVEASTLLNASRTGQAITGVTMTDMEESTVPIVTGTNDTYLMLEEGNASLWSEDAVPGRVLTSGYFFPREETEELLHDVAVATLDGEIWLFRNHGSLHFTREAILQVNNKVENWGLSVRGLDTFRLENGLDGIVAAVYNPGMTSKGLECAYSYHIEPESAHEDLVEFPCANAFVFYPDMEK